MPTNSEIIDAARTAQVHIYNSVVRGLILGRPDGFEVNNPHPSLEITIGEDADLEQVQQKLLELGWELKDVSGAVAKAYFIMTEENIVAVLEREAEKEARRKVKIAAQADRNKTKD
jgi:hypothetical protein